MWHRGVLCAWFGLFLLAGCRSSDGPFARAAQIESLSDAIGGPQASARVGDFLLENEQVRLVVEQGGASKLPLDRGGTLVDFDLVRPDARFRGGKGLDQLGQIAPVANLFLARADVDKAVRITQSERGAEVTVSSEGVPVQKVLEALSFLLKRDFISPSYDYGELRLYNEYELRPGERLVRIQTTVGFDVPFCRPLPDEGCNAACDDVFYDEDCQCPSIPPRCLRDKGAAPQALSASALPDRPEPMGLSDVLLGDLPRPIGSRRCTATSDCQTSLGETCVDITGSLGGVSRVCRTPEQRGAGVFVGDMLIFGGQLQVFLPGSGFDADSDIRALFDSGQDTLSEPLKLDGVFALGDRVSYGYGAPEGKVLVPIFGGPFSLGATAAASCRTDSPGCLSRRVVRTERWVSIGEGDAASALEPLLRARGTPLGAVTGGVRWAHSGKPVVGAEVYALADPRGLACDEACRARCGDLSQLLDDTLREWSAEEVIAANRCRTPGGAHLDGRAEVATMARTDVGTDPLPDGRFRLPLPPGTYVLLSVRGDTAISRPLPVRVEAEQNTEAAFWLQEPGRLHYRMVDGAGQPLPGRISVGQCFALGPCQSDADCNGAAGELCQQGACACERRLPRPFELGGARMPDGLRAAAYAVKGEGTLELPAGDYEVLFSFGPHASLDRQNVTVRSGLTTEVRGQVVRTVDTQGYVAADFHVHAEPSIDSGASMEDRVTSMVGEDVQFLSSSDHDRLSRYAPLIEKMGQRPHLASHVGVEVTTQELGHFVGFPMRYQEWTSEGHPSRLPGNGAPEWRELTPGQIFDAIRQGQDEGGLVQVAHPYSYFDSYGLDPKTLEPTESILALFNPLVEAKAFSGRFDSMELMNSKSFDLLRRPTVGEVRFYSQGLDALGERRRKGELDTAAWKRAVYALSTEVTRRMLHRTWAEQEAARAGVGAELACRCGSDGDCSSGRVCDAATLACVLPGERSLAPPPPDEALCRSLRGTLDDWFNMLNRGVRRGGVSGSDTHGMYGADGPGVPRTLLPSEGAKPEALRSEQVVRAVREGRAVVTNGPMIHFRVNGAGLGDEVTAKKGEPLSLELRVETAGWYDVDRIEVYRNGELIHWLSGCEARRTDEPVEPHGHPCLPLATVVAFSGTLTDTPDRDAWYVALAYGLDGRTLSPVYSSAVQSRLGTFEVTQRLYDIVPALSGLRTPRFPSLYPTFPAAATNPIWVDLDADGWKPSLPPPSWCTPGQDLGCP